MLLEDRVFIYECMCIYCRSKHWDLASHVAIDSNRFSIIHESLHINSTENLMYSKCHREKTNHDVWLECKLEC